METLPENPVLEFNADTMQVIRKLYNLDKPGRMDEAINIIEEWVKKQDHFVKKDFSRDYLERIIIGNKGLLERVKMRLDRTCTLRTLIPQYFGPFNVKEDFEELHPLTEVVLPKLTPDNNRVLIIRIKGKEISNNFFLNYYRKFVIVWEYILKHDYSTGFVLVMDFTELNLMALIAKMDITELRQTMSLFLGGYGLRMKGLHIITTSKLVDTLTAILKQVYSEKMGKRIYTHANIEALYDILSKDMLPVDYGGKEKSLMELHGKWLEVLSSKEHMEYMNIMNGAKTDESRRAVDKFNEQYFGTPGTFRTIAVD